MDITSVKTAPVAAMHQHIKAGQILGIHPVFGPGAKDMINQNFVLTPTYETETALAQKVKQYLENRGARVTLMSPQEHDEMMTVILGLSHFIAIVSAETLLSFDRFPQTKAVAGTTYKVLLTLIESVLSEEPELYASLQTSLPHLADIERSFQSKAAVWADLVANKDAQQFAQKMSQLKEKLKQANADFGQAYENMYKLVRDYDHP